MDIISYVENAYAIKLNDHHGNQWIHPMNGIPFEQRHGIQYQIDNH